MLSTNKKIIYFNWAEKLSGFSEHRFKIKTRKVRILEVQKREGYSIEKYKLINTNIWLDVQRGNP